MAKMAIADFRDNTALFLPFNRSAQKRYPCKPRKSRGNGPNHVAIFLGISLIGALWVPLNPDAKGHSLAHAIGIADPVLAFTTPIAREQLERAGLKPSCIVVETDGWQLPPRTAPHEAKLPKTDPQDVRAVLFTSGTSGPPKGVMVSEQMLVASAAGTAQASDCQSGDVFLMWEPLHHIGGSQIVVMALIHLTPPGDGQEI